MESLKHLFERNKDWAAAIKAEDPDYFLNLSKQQTPGYLWIGCSDSRVPANQIVNLPPGEVFVHRNIANVVVHTDLNCLSVIQFAVEYLKVEHIVVCGHYGCGGVQAALDEKQYGLLDNWLGHIKDVARLNADQLQGLESHEKLNLLCELNVKEQFANVCHTSVVQKAWGNGAKLTVYGWIYSIADGILNSLCARNAAGELFDTK
ncbi:MAG: carbonate dehydratase [Xanthomonadales bacterium]|nr:carbonate dehydratase [Gammaproteobacteria bacterium]NNK05098.1 carbonate dehydratase [Xanthomonadales bacterium]